MATYHIDEAEFEIPEGWIDQSINIFAAGTTPPLPLSLVISRDRWPPEQDFATTADAKLAELKSRLKQFRLLEKRQLTVAGVLALETEFTWRADQGPMHQRQIFVPAQGVVLVITATAPVKIAEEQREEIERLLSTFRLKT
jgi:hypothetical protein